MCGPLARCLRLRRMATRTANAVSVGVRGPVSIQSAFSESPVSVTSLQITKSVNLETAGDPDQKGSDAMGYKHRVDFGTYVTCGSINVQLAQKTGFSKEDAEALKEALRTIFMNDASSARPDGSMEVIRLVWWEHNCASRAVFRRGRCTALCASRRTGPRFRRSAWRKVKSPGLRYELIEGASQKHAIPGKCCARTGGKRPAFPGGRRAGEWRHDCAS